MFVLRNVGKLLFGSGGSQESVVELPQGQLYLVRPLSPKSYSELIFKDAAARIRRTAQEFHYQLVVQRVYEEGEAELLAEEEGDDTQVDDIASERDEKTFLLDEALYFRVEIREGSEKVVAWRDLSGDLGDVYEFVCDASTPTSLISQFDLVAKQCQYERKYRKPHVTASEVELAQFETRDQKPIPPASPIHSPTHRIDSVDSMVTSNQTPKVHLDTNPIKHGKESLRSSPVSSSAASRISGIRVPRPARVLPIPQFMTQYATEVAELHFFDFPAGAFVIQEASVTICVAEVGKWQYWLQVMNGDKPYLDLPITADINPVFNFEFLSFIFNQFCDGGSAYSWLLRFKDQPTLERFQEALLRCLWEQLNEIKWEKVKEREREYVTDAFADLTMEEAPGLEDGEGEHDEDEEEEEDSTAAGGNQFSGRSKDGQGGTDDDDDDDDDAASNASGDGLVNSQLAVGYKYDRSFVVRGSKIGVFTHSNNNQLKFSTTISKVQTPNGTLFSPKKVMLHNEDRSMIMQHQQESNKLYRMDLEYGKVVDEWKVHDDIPIMTFAPDSKFAQMTQEQTFLGASHNALYRVDPRLSGNKLVESQLKQYSTKNDFSALATTEKGYIAVASNKGDVRLFDRLGINAKTHIPALGEPIIGLDVSADGHWVLATCRTYLLLIDVMQKSGKNQDKLGFERAFPADSKPMPRRLGLSPEHVAQFVHETGRGISFTPAKFNAGEGVEEKSIITATGPFVITWDLRKVLRGAKAPYLIKRYAEDIKADDFRFGSDKAVIVALPNEVGMVGKQGLKKPTRQSIAGTGEPSLSAEGRRSSGRITSRQSGKYKLGKDDIVSSY